MVPDWCHYVDPLIFDNSSTVDIRRVDIGILKFKYQRGGGFAALSKRRSVTVRMTSQQMNAKDYKNRIGVKFLVKTK